MPIMDGAQAAKKIQEALLQNAPRIVIVTAFDREDVYIQAQTLNISAILTKPVNASSLTDCLVSIFADDDPAASALPEDKEETGLRGMRVLLTEDNLINQQIATELLNSVGVEVVVANHGQEALELLAARDAAYFDVILMDMQMPVMDGYEASRRIRAQTRYDLVPLIAMTAHAMVEERARCLALGMNDHISKPIDPLQFFACLKHWKSTAVVPMIVQVTEKSEKTAAPAVVRQELDIQVGLGYVLNNSSLYLRMLKQFCSSEADCVQRTHQALQANDLEPALRYAHTLKGLTATLGATPVSVLAGRIELAISQGGGLAEVKDDLLQLEQRLAVLIREVQDYIHSEDPFASTPAPSDKMAEKELLELLAWLERLLLDMDAEALTVLGKYDNAMAVWFDPADFAAFRIALEKFNFGDALPILQKMSKAVQGDTA